MVKDIKNIKILQYSKRHYYTKHVAKFDVIQGHLRLDEIKKIYKVNFKP